MEGCYGIGWPRKDEVLWTFSVLFMRKEGKFLLAIFSQC